MRTKRRVPSRDRQRAALPTKKERPHRAATVREPASPNPQPSGSGLHRAATVKERPYPPRRSGPAEPRPSESRLHRTPNRQGAGFTEPRPSKSGSTHQEGAAPPSRDRQAAAIPPLKPEAPTPAKLLRKRSHVAAHLPPFSKNRTTSPIPGPETGGGERSNGAPIKCRYSGRPAWERRPLRDRKKLHPPPVISVELNTLMAGAPAADGTSYAPCWARALRFSSIN